jgi:hypothetical protein
MSETPIDLASISPEDFTREAQRRGKEARDAHSRQVHLEYEMRQAKYAEQDRAKAAEIGITVDQLREAMDWADEIRDDRW